MGYTKAVLLFFIALCRSIISKVVIRFNTLGENVVFKSNFYIHCFYFTAMFDLIFAAKTIGLNAKEFGKRSERQL
jgi:hypothetical protein